MKARRQPAVKNAFRHARVTTNARSGACGTGRSARRWHGGQIGAARTATQPHARFLILNLNSMVHSALNNMTNNLAHHQHFSSPSTSRAPRAGAFDAQVPHASRTLFPDCESPRTIPHAPPFAPLIAHQLVQLVAQHPACDVHESPRAAQGSEFRRRMESVAAALEPPLQVPCAAATCVPSASVNKIVALCAFLPNVDPSQLHDISFMLCNGYLPEVTERNPDFH